MAHYVITIDGKVVDLGDANITLTWKSNLFTDLSKITGNHSYTINLPKSQTNRMIFGIPEMPGFNSTKVRKYLSATIEMDGIMIADNARAVLTNADSDSYSVALTWGLGAAIQKIADAGKTLQELVDLNESLAWDSTSTLMTYGANSNYGFAYADYGFRTLPSAASRSIYYHPCVSAKWILSKIASQHSASISLPAELNNNLKNIYIPLVARIDSESIANANKVVRNVRTDISISSTAPSAALNFDAAGNTPYGDAGDRWGYTVKVDSDLSINIDINIETSIDRDFVPTLYFVCEQDGERNMVDDYIEHNDRYLYLEKWYVYNFRKKIILSNIQAGARVFICVTPDLVTTAHRSGNMAIVHTVKKLPYPWAAYPIIANLPDIKQIDFIKMICAMYGYTVSTTAYGLSFVRISTVYYNAGYIFYDWSSYMLYGSAKVTYTFSDFAQRNWIRWKESDEGIEEDAAYITVNNNTLTAEKDLIKFPLSNSKGSEIPCYSFNKDGDLEYKACKSRIMQAYKRSDGTVGLSFNGLRAQELIANNYGAYASLVSAPFTVKASFHIPAYMLKNIDMYKPVYLSHYGCFFAIISINNNNGVSEVELLKI